VEDIRGDLWYGTPTRYVRPHPAHSTTLTFPLEHPFNTIPHSSTSLASKSELEVDLYGVSVAFPCHPLPLQARASRKCIFTMFWHNSQHLHPPSSQVSILVSSTSLMSSGCRFDTILASTSLACKMMSMLINPAYCLHQIYNLGRLHGSVN